MRRFVIILAVFSSVVYSLSGMENLARREGVKVTASGHYRKFTPDKAVDGNDKSDASRWLSPEGAGPHVLTLDFGEKVEFNCVVLKFWQRRRRCAADLDVEVKRDGRWIKVASVRNNVEQVVRCIFDEPADSSGMRVVFLRDNSADGMIRLYELEVFLLPITAKFSAAFSRGFLLPGTAPEVELRCFGDAGNIPEFEAELVDSGGRVVTSLREKLDFSSGSATVRLPLPPRYGRFTWRSEFFPPRHFVYIPSAPGTYKSASPFGAHYQTATPEAVRHAGIFWWRPHDDYGRWDMYMSSTGVAAWERYEEKLRFVRENGIRECQVYLGAPRCYSTIIPGEAATARSDSDWLYSYYPPADLQAWRELYLLPVAERLKAASPGLRAHEIWNEPWSYYRLRGLRGTPAEATLLYRTSYETLKEVDPAAPVFGTDSKPQMLDTRFGFRQFGRDMFELGYLRWCDVLAYHDYSMMTRKKLELIRRNAWEFGRELPLWNTEVGMRNASWQKMMESLIMNRALGADKYFIYSHESWVPFFRRNVPTQYLVAQAALSRNLGDALPLGIIADGKDRFLVFGNGGEVVVLGFSSGTGKRHLPFKVPAGAAVEDVFGNPLNSSEAVLSATTPVFVRRAPDELMFLALNSELERLRSEPGGDEALRGVASGEKKIGSSSLDTAVKTLRARRRELSDDPLYVSGKALDLLQNAQLVLLRRRNLVPNLRKSAEELTREAEDLFRRIYERSGHRGILLQTERLASRGRKELLTAAMYGDDGDTCARNFYLNAAADSLAAAAARLEKNEPVAERYRCKSYFRSDKRRIRSEVYCFPNGRAQKAVITLANPFGSSRQARLRAVLPPGWRAEPEQMELTVPERGRTLGEVLITAPEAFIPGEVHRLQWVDEAGVFPPLPVDCEIVETVPPFPVLGEEKFSPTSAAGNGFGEDAGN